MNNGQKPKLEAHIYLLEDGRVMMNYSSKNTLTILGLLEAAKTTLLQTKPEESNIVVPRIQ